MTRDRLRKLNIFLIFFFGFALFGFFLLNGGAFARNIRYELFLNSPFASEDLEGEILEVAPATAGAASGNGRQFYLEIPKINSSAPIIIPEDTSTKGVLANLEEGVGLYPGSSLPGQAGRAIVLGHSSRASWYRGDYANVFSLLPKLSEGDEFYVTADRQKFIYRIYSKKILTPSETNAALALPLGDSEIDLITCYPIGSASKRTLIQAKLVAIENI